MTNISTDAIVCRPGKMLPLAPSSACFVRALSLTSISAFTYFPAVVLVIEIVVQRISGPFDVMYGSLETLAAYCDFKRKFVESNSWVVLYESNLKYWNAPRELERLHLLQLGMYHMAGRNWFRVRKRTKLPLANRTSYRSSLHQIHLRKVDKLL